MPLPSLLFPEIETLSLIFIGDYDINHCAAQDAKKRSSLSNVDAYFDKSS